jgi:hypothetical protein
MVRQWGTVFFFASSAYVAEAPLNAQTAERYSVEFSPSLGYSSNPFLLEDAPGSATLQLGTAARYRIIGERRETSFDARADVTQYLRRYGSSSGYGAGVTHRERFSERAELNARADFDSSILGERFGVVRTLEPNQGTSPEAPFDPDIGLLGLRQRRTSYGIAANLSLQPTVDQQIGIAARVGRSDYSGGFSNSDFWSYGLTGSYLKALSGVTKAGAQFAISKTDYEQELGSFLVMQPQLVLQHRLSPSWELSAGAGLSFIEASGPGLGDTLSWSAALQSCRAGARDSICLNLDRSTSPSGRGGVRTSSSASASYTYRLSEREDLSVSGNFTHFGRAMTQAEVGSSKAWTINGAYQRRFAERLTGRASAAVRGFSENTRDAIDGTALISLAYRIGTDR